MARDERNLKWDNLDQIKFDASAQLRSVYTNSRPGQIGRNGSAKIQNMLKSDFVQKYKHFHRRDIINLRFSESYIPL